ncbi:MAG: Sec23/Sec24 trunk domain-containing protein [Benjaminiella poitrasii]|nr:MAG: Sec23/Sec24 trunk domain-containing protein [Benjaminiella poitrasii]
MIGQYSVNVPLIGEDNKVHPVTQKTPESIQPIQQNNKRQQMHQTQLISNNTYNLASLNLTAESSNRNGDVALLGNPSLVHDFDRPSIVPEISINASVTSSECAQCDSSYQRCTLNALPNSHYLLRASKLPLSVIIEPYPAQPLTLPPVISRDILHRCRQCKSFINPFIQFIEGGLKWQCNICGSNDNDVPASFDWNPIRRQKVDRWSLPELNHGCVDYIATPEFFSHPTQPPTYLFLIDVSQEALERGTTEVLAESLMASLESIPNKDGRVGFMTVSDVVGFFAFSTTRQEEVPFVELLVVPDLDSVSLPRAAEDLLVSLSTCTNRAMVLAFLARLKTMFYAAPKNNDNCLGPAMKAARLLLSSTGGKIICFQASSPMLGEGAVSASLVQKQHMAIMKDEESRLLLEPASGFYKAFSEHCVRSHISVDMFVFGNQQVDIATLNVLPSLTGGETHYFPGFSAGNQSDRLKLKSEICKLIREEVGLEAIMRTKCSPGLICTAYHGHFSFQSPDILVLPNVSRSGSYCIDLDIERRKGLRGDFGYLQTCLLFTTSKGERIIRVMTTCLPVTKNMTDVFYKADQMSIAKAISCRAIDKAITSRIKAGREYLIQQITDICRSYGKEVIGITATTKNIHLSLSSSLSILPVLILGLLKSEAFNDMLIAPKNMSSQSTILLKTLPMNIWTRYAYPVLYSLHNMPAQAGTMNYQSTIIMPPRLNLSHGKLEHHGCYLVENGQHIILCIGKHAVPQLCLDLLNMPNVGKVQSCQIESLPVLRNIFSQKVRRIVEHIQTNLCHGNFYPSLYIVKENDGSMLYSWFLTHLIEDRHQGTPLTGAGNSLSSMSYFQWLHFIKEKI